MTRNANIQLCTVRKQREVSGLIVVRIRVCIFVSGFSDHESKYYLITKSKCCAAVVRSFQNLLWNLENILEGIKGAVNDAATSYYGSYMEFDTCDAVG